MKITKRHLKRIIREEKRKILKELGGPAYSNLRAMEPDPTEAMSQKTLSSVATDQLNYLHGFMSEVERVGGSDPRAEDIGELYFQLIERLNAVLEIRESTSTGGIYGGGPEDQRYGSDDEEVYYDAQRAVENDMRNGTIDASRDYSDVPEEQALFEEFYDELIGEWEESEVPEYEDEGYEVDPERNYMSGNRNAEPDYYDPSWGDSRNEDY